MSESCRIGVLGASKIAPLVMVEPAGRMDGVEVVAIAARDRTRAEAWAAANGVPVVEDTYASLIESDLDAVYIPLHAGGHREWAVKAAQAGKHVLVEKPFSLNTSEAEEMVAAGRAAGVMVVSAFHYWYHPLMQRVLELVRGDTMGSLHSVEASFHGPELPLTPEWAVYTDPALGGSTLTHCGCYPLHFVRSVAGEPTSIKAEGELGAAGSDVSVTAHLEFGSSVTGTVVSTMTGPPRPFVYDAAVQFERGELIARNFVLPHMDMPMIPLNTENDWNPQALPIDVEMSGWAGNLTIRADGEPEWTEYFGPETTYWYQLLAFVRAIRDGSEMHTSGDDILQQARTTDAIFEAAGL